MNSLLDNLSLLLAEHGCTFTDLILELLKPQYEHILSKDILSSSARIIEAFGCHPVSCQTMRDFASTYAIEIYAGELEELTSVNAGWHFNITHTAPEQLDEFRLEEMADDMRETAPCLTAMIDTLMSGKRRLNGVDEMEVDDDKSSDDGEGEEGAMLGDVTVREPAVSARQQVKQVKRHTQKLPAVRAIKRVAISSMLMQARNQKANWLQSLCGVFLHANNTPQKVIDAFAQLGLCISIPSIHRALRSLTAHAKEQIQTLGQTLTVAYCYDNFDIDLKPSVPTVEKSGETLKHLTAGFIFPLQHGTTKEDLRCSNYLWERSLYNPAATETFKYDWWKLLSVHADTRIPDHAGLTASDRFNAWQFLHDLIHHGPAEFHVYKQELGLPEVLEQIPIVKTPITPLEATLDNNSEIAGNIDTIRHLLEQTGVGDPKHSHKKSAVDVSEHVIIMHGDVGTGEKVDLALERWAPEASPWLRLQFVVFVDGPFHLKMACADAPMRYGVS